MVGFPETLNTKEDYEYIRKNFPKEQWRPAFRNLLDTMHAWFNTGEIAGDGLTDDTHKIAVDEQNNIRYQYEYKVDTNCKLLRLGYTENEVKGYVEDSV